MSTTLQEDLRNATGEVVKAKEVLLGKSAEIDGSVGAMREEVTAHKDSMSQQMQGIAERDAPAHVNGILSKNFYIDPDNGDDANNGIAQSEPVKTVARLVELLEPNGKRYFNVVIYVAKNSVLEVDRPVKALGQILFYTFGEGDNKPVIKQATRRYAYISARRVMFGFCDVATYRSPADEEYDASYWLRYFVAADSIEFNNALLTVHDNPLIHMHTGGSGYIPKPLGIYFGRLSSLRFAASNAGVTGSKTLCTNYGGVTTSKLSLYVHQFTLDLGGVHADLAAALGWSANSVESNLQLT